MPARMRPSVALRVVLFAQFLQGPPRTEVRAMSLGSGCNYDAARFPHCSARRLRGGLGSSEPRRRSGANVTVLGASSSTFGVRFLGECVHSASVDPAIIEIEECTN